MSETGPSIPTSTIEYYRPLPAPTATPQSPRYWLHALLLVATAFTTLVMGARMQYNFDHNRPALSLADESLAYFPAAWLFSHPAQLGAGWPFAVTLMLFFLAHEMGHYLLCRRYGIHATLPFFIPFPTPVGTMGAIILIRSKIHSRAALFDIAIAGPIAGFIVALVVLLISLGWAKPALSAPNPNDLRIELPLIFRAMHQTFSVLSPMHPASRLPLSRILLHPASIAAWVGMYATALNLLPSGQLDGGHIVYALAPRAHRTISWITVIALVGLGSLAYRKDHMNYGWWVWAGLITVMNLLTIRQQQAPDHPALAVSRWALALFAGLMLMLTFTVSPFQISW
jgi:membrane-associated protease RseP (regulator of RpoE activity)